MKKQLSIVLMSITCLMLFTSCEVMGKKVNTDAIGAGILILIFGVLVAVFPGFFGRFVLGSWKYKDAELSDTAVVVTRVLGIVFAIIGILLPIIL